MNEKRNNGWVPLHHAANNGHMEVVELLIAADADMNAKDNYGEYGKTPLDYANG